MLVFHVKLVEFILSYFFVFFFSGWFNHIVLLIAAVQCELPLSGSPSAANLPGK